MTYPLHNSNRQSISMVLAASADYEDGTFSEDTILITGRVIAIRGHGRLMFVDVADDSGSIQLMVRAQEQTALTVAEQLGRGDLVQAEGPNGRSRRGEISIMANNLLILAPCNRDLPEVVGDDITDTETLRRQRTLDLLIHEDARERLIQRSLITQAMRALFLTDDYLEVETPILQAQAGGAEAAPFVTRAQALSEDRYLRIAPEFYLERLVIAGMPRVFEFARNFRNEGIDRTHNPEFTALEWYGSYETLDQQRQRCQDLIQAAASAINSDIMNKDIAIRSWEELWHATYTCDPMNEAEVQAALPGAPEGLNHAQLLAWGWDQIEPTLQDPVFVVRWPSMLSSLARPEDDDARWAGRWDLYINGIELGAGYQELTDPDMQRQLMGDDVDEEFLADMALGMPPTSGAGLGIDRLVMVLTGAEHIRQTIAFPDFRRGLDASESDTEE